MGDGHPDEPEVAHEMSRDRRRAIRVALELAEDQEHLEWDRSAEWGIHRVVRRPIRPGSMRTIEMPLLDQNMGDSWPIPISIIRGSRPGPTVTIIGGIHGDELTGISTGTNLLSTNFTDPGGPLHPENVAGMIVIVPVVNLPGYRMRSRYFPDRRDLNRCFPGDIDGNTTRRVAHRVWKEVGAPSDYIIDVHAAAKGRTNMPQLRANLTHPQSNMLARAFGIEVVLDSTPPQGSLRRCANDADIGAITYEGGGADVLDQTSVKVAVHGILNVLRALKVTPGDPDRPAFRLLARGGTWLRASEGGLLDMRVGPGSFVHEGDTVASISDPSNPSLAMEIYAPHDGIFIGTATNPFVTAGTPFGHFLRLKRHSELVASHLDERSRLRVQGSDEGSIWRSEHEVTDIELDGEWSGGSVDAEWTQGVPLESTGDEQDEDFEDA